VVRLVVVAKQIYIVAVVRLDVAERGDIVVVNIVIAKRSDSIAEIRLENAVEREIIVFISSNFILDVVACRY